MKKTLYEQAGVESDKGHIKEAFSLVNSNEFPHAFVNITTDAWESDWVMTMHSDGSGSRSVTHWLYYAETGSDRFLPYDIADSIAMNADVVAGGFTGPFVFINTIGINSNNIDKPLIIKKIATGLLITTSLLSDFGFRIFKEGEGSISQVYSLGGETADLLDQINSWTVDVSVFSRMPRKEGIITGNVQPRDTIFAFSSGGQASWENRPNSGHMSNGSTLSGPILLSANYQKKYPFLRTEKNAFRGPFKIDKHIDSLNMTVGEALLSPTRQWAIVMKKVIEGCKNDGCFDKLHAIVMNTGGGLTKCVHVGKGIRYEKKIPPFLPIFQLIQDVSRETTLGMMKTFNCGIGLEVIGNNSDGCLGKVIADVSDKSGISAYTMGHCLPTQDPSGENEVVVEYKGQKYGPKWK
jgi:phosphoribosylformylglycinamidine cyclo-ligase